MLTPSIFGRDFFDDFFDDPWFDNDMRRTEKKLYGHHGKNMMSTDIKERDNEYELEMELPGFKLEDISAELENGYLTITANKSVEQKEDQKYIRKERYSGTCSRSFYVGDAVTKEDIKASFHHGILQLIIPKKENKPQVENKNYIAIEG